MEKKSAVVSAAVVVAGLMAAADPSALSARRQSNVRTIYVSATDNKGAVITDLRADEFEVKVGGKKLEVASAEPAQMPLRIAVIVSDAGTGAYQQSLANFMQKLLGHAEFSLISVIAQPEVVTDYSSEGAVLSAGLKRLGARGRQRGAQLLEAIAGAVKGVSYEGRRPVILVVRVGAEATTSLTGDDVLEQLRRSGAVLYVVSSLGAQRQAPSNARSGISTEQSQMQDADANEAFLNLSQVLGDGSKDSGGRHDQVVSTTPVPTLERIADELLNQYALKCALPDGVKMTDKLSVSAKRRGVKILAPARLGGG